MQEIGLSHTCFGSPACLGGTISPFRSPGPDGAREEEEALPVTSYICQWKRPRKRKESTMKMSEAIFEKHIHVYGRTKKRENFLHLKISIIAHHGIRVQPDL